MTVGSPAKNILIFTIPLIIGNLFQLIYNWTDAIIIGQTMGPNAFGSLSASLPVVNLLLTVTLGFMTGAVVILGQLYGAKDYERFKRSLATILIVLCFGSLFLMVVGTLLSRPLLRLLNVSSEQIDASAEYLTIYFLGIFAMAFYNAIAQILRAVGNSTTPLVVLICGTLLNVALDLLFVLVFQWGIKGVAIATVLAQALSAIACFLYMQKKFPLLKLTWKELRFDKKLFGNIMKVAVPSMVQQFCASAGFIAINALINKNGADYTTSFGLGNRIDELISMQFMSFGIALTSFSAQNKGINDIKRMRSGLRSTLLISLAFLLVGGGFLLLFKDQVISLFMSMDDNLAGNPAMVAELTSQFLIITVPSYILLAVMLVVSGLLRGAGDPIAAMNVNVFSLICRIIAAFVLDYFFGYLGVFIASPVGWFGGMMYALLRYKGNKWTHKEVISLPTAPLEEHSDVAATSSKI